MKHTKYQCVTADRLAAITSFGVLLRVGDTVTHDGAPGETATVEAFFERDDDGRIMAKTSRGVADIEFLNKPRK